jgi:hypothetical protein
MGPDSRRVAIEECKAIEQSVQGGLALVAAAYRLAITGPIEELLPLVRQMVETSGFGDPEGVYLLGVFVANGTAHDLALELLERAVLGGFHCPAAMRLDPYWDSVRQSPTFTRLLAVAEAGSARARDAFVRAGGESVLRR